MNDNSTVIIHLCTFNFDQMLLHICIDVHTYEDGHMHVCCKRNQESRYMGFIQVIFINRNYIQAARESKRIFGFVKNLT